MIALYITDLVWNINLNTMAMKSFYHIIISFVNCYVQWSFAILTNIPKTLLSNTRKHSKYCSLSNNYASNISVISKHFNYYEKGSK